MNFREFDIILCLCPKDINKLIFEYYDEKCRRCNTNQIYCNTCELYNCPCYKEIDYCNVMECHKILCCENKNDICNSNCNCCEKSRYLCDRCWNIDI